MNTVIKIIRQTYFRLLNKKVGKINNNGNKNYNKDEDICLCEYLKNKKYKDIVLTIILYYTILRITENDRT